MLDAFTLLARSRRGWFAIFAVSALVLRFASQVAPGAGLGHLQSMLSEVAACEEPEQLYWEPSTRRWLDTLFGRSLFFLCRPSPESKREVYRARVRTSPEGHLLSIASIHNLSHTPLGDEGQLQHDGRFVAFSTFAAGRQEGITLLDVEGPSVDAGGGLMNRILVGAMNFASTGSVQGLGRVQIRSATDASLTLKLESDSLSILKLGQVVTVLPLLSIEGRAFEGGIEISIPPPAGDLWLHNLVDIVRGSVGPMPIAWLEAQVFGLRDRFRRRAFWSRPSMETEPASLPPVTSLAGRESKDAAGWPPRDLVPQALPAQQGEGRWVVPDQFKDETANRDALFRQTYLLPDPDRPYARLNVVAMDMRRLELRMEGGFEEPRPKAGPPGAGALPKKAELLRRVEATFNGAFKSMHGDYGMMVDGHILVPPKPSAASVVVTEDGRTGFGDWPSTSDVPSGLRSFRQNLDPLVASGEVNPRGRRFWGDPVAGQSVVTERSGLCLARNGHIYYAWGQDLTGLTLARGLQRAGCEYAIHLDMNPGHTGFFYHQIDGVRREQVRSMPAWAELQMPASRHVFWSPKDFFYVVRRGGVTGGGSQWRPSPGAQPDPSSLPGILEARTELGSLAIQLMRFEANRLAFHLVAGADEPLIAGRPAPTRELERDISNVQVAVSLGRTTVATRLGLAFGTRITMPWREAHATLLIDDSGLQVLPAGQSIDLDDSQYAVQLPSLVVGGQLTARATVPGARRARGAVCVVSDGSVLIAQALHDSSDVLALALQRSGCTDVLELDRGAKHAMFVHRAGTSEAPRASYPVSVLYGLNQSMRPRTFKFETSSYDR